MEGLPSALAILTAMITPAVLISACGTLILSTSTRAGRVVDRVRTLSDIFEELTRGERQLVLLEERRELIYHQLDRLTSRARLLQRSMTFFYFALGIFVATSVAIGVVAISSPAYGWVPVVLALLGACCLFYGSMLLIFEARLALSSVHAEMDFVWRLGRHLAPEEELPAVGRRSASHLPFRRFRSAPPSSPD